MGKYSAELKMRLEAVSRSCFLRKVILKISQNLQKTPMPDSHFIITLQAEAGNFIKKETRAQMFSCEILRTPFLQNTFGRLLLVVLKWFDHKVPQKLIFIKVTIKHFKVSSAFSSAFPISEWVVDFDAKIKINLENYKCYFMHDFLTKCCFDC